MKKSVAGACALALVALLAGGAAGAGKAGDRCCAHSFLGQGRRARRAWSTTYHDGSGTGSSRQQAERSAIVSWSEFTAWEYGTPWGRYSQSR